MPHSHIIPISQEHVISPKPPSPPIPPQTSPSKPPSPLVSPTRGSSSHQPSPKSPPTTIQSPLPTSPKQPSPTREQPVSQPIPSTVLEATHVTSQKLPPSPHSSLSTPSIPQYKPNTKTKSPIPFPQIQPEPSSDTPSPSPIQSSKQSTTEPEPSLTLKPTTKPISPPKKPIDDPTPWRRMIDYDCFQPQPEPDSSTILLESSIYQEMIEANALAYKKNAELMMKTKKPSKAMPLLAFRNPPPPKVPILASKPTQVTIPKTSSSSSSTPPPPSTSFTLKKQPPTTDQNLIYMEHDEYMYQMATNLEAMQKSATEMKDRTTYIAPDYPFPELKDPTYTAKVVVKPKVYDAQLISVRPPSPQPLPLLPSQSLALPAPPPPSRPPTTITYRLKRTAHKSSSPSKTQPS